MKYMRHAVCLAALFLTGCGGPKPLTLVKVNVPAAASMNMQMVDHEIASPVANFLRSDARVKAAMTVSRQGAFEAYVQIEASGHARQDVEDLLKRAGLPPAAGVPVVTVVSGTMPKVEPKMVPTANVHLDLTRASVIGVSSADVSNAMDKLPGKSGIVELRELTVTDNKGDKVRLSEIATFTESPEPDCIVRKWP